MQNLYEKIKEEKKDLIKKEKQNEEKTSLVELINIDLLDEFKTHIFSKLPDDKFLELKESIKRNGVLSPIIVRKKESRYEIISGHNRVNCCRELELKEVPCIVKDYSDDVAELVMIETNLTQREDILLCEKGLAYKKQLELLKKIKKENWGKDSSINGLDNCRHNGDNLEDNEYVRSIDELSQNSSDSIRGIQRLIRLTELISNLQQKVNAREIPLLSGVELSYIKVEEQEIIDKYITENNIQLTVPQAQRLREHKGELTEELIDEIITGNKNREKNIKFTGKVQRNIYKKYKEKFKDDKEFSIIVDKLLEEYFNNQEEIK